MNVYFSDVFKVSPEILEQHGAFNISIVTDFPLFVDPFLLFNSQNPIYQNLHADIIKYLTFLRNKAAGQPLTDGLILAWYKFPEVKQNWLGFTEESNAGRGLGPKFARALHRNLNNIFNSFGKETVTRGSHLEKLCLIDEGVGKDRIGDFTANLIKGFLVNYTSDFAQKYIAPELRRRVSVARVKFNYVTEVWESGVFDLPYLDDDFVLLSPKDMLTKDDTWINKSGLYSGFEDIPNSIPNDQLRAQINNYFYSVLPKEPKKEERENAIESVIAKFPELIDYYIKSKEDNGERAADISAEKVTFSLGLYVEQFSKLGKILAKSTPFYSVPGNTYDEAMEKVLYLKQVVENNDGYRIFYLAGQPIQKEKDLHILYKLTWLATPSDVNQEVNNGRGPVDFKVSRGAKDKTLVEFKLASNPSLERNLLNQTRVYEKANQTRRSIKVIVFFSSWDYNKVITVLKKHKLENDRSIVLIDARRDNKPSGSKADEE